MNPRALRRPARSHPVLMDDLEPRRLFAAGLVKDLVPGTNGSQPDNFVATQSALYFNSGGLWKSDGTTGGTQRVTSTPLTNLTNINGTLFFIADQNEYIQVNGNQLPIGSHTELWKSTGTQAGTVPNTEIDSSPSNGNNAFEAVAVNGILYFAGGTAGSIGLWRSDGTAAGTRLVKATDAYGLTNVAGTLYFASSAGLWKSDGTAGGTVLLNDGIDRISQLTAVGNKLFFSARGPGRENFINQELWVSDGTVLGTRSFEIAESILGSNPSDFVAFNGVLYFAANDQVAGNELWRSDGTDSGTSLVQDINPGQGSSNPSDLVVSGGSLYFAADDGSHGEELRKYDGSQVFYVDINHGSDSSSPRNLADVNGVLYFSAYDATNGREPHRGNATGTRFTLLTDINNGLAGSNPALFTAFGPGVVFDADDGIHGTELWAADLQPATGGDAQPSVTIADASVTEGNIGSTNISFTVSLSTVAAVDVSVSYSTGDGTATAGQDYTAQSGVVTIPAGQTTANITVSVAGDMAVEADETFVVNLTAPTNATLARAQAIGTITNDDSPNSGPSLAIDVRDSLTGLADGSTSVVTTQPFVTTLTVNNRLGLWLGITASHSAGNDKLMPPGGISGFLTGQGVISANGSVSYGATFAQPGETVSVAMNINNVNAVAANVLNILATAAGSTLTPDNIFNALADIEKLAAVRTAVGRLSNIPTSPKQRAKLVAKTANDLRKLVTDKKQAKVVVAAIGKLGLKVSPKTVQKLFGLSAVKTLIQTIASEVVLIVQTGGRDIVEQFVSRTNP